MITFGTFCAGLNDFGAGEHFGGFWFGLKLADVPGHRVAINA
jgi:hypothetical protein